MKSHMKLWVFALLATIVSQNFQSSSGLTVDKNGGYTVVLAIKNDEAKPENVDTYINNIKNSFRTLSAKMWIATRESFYIASLEIILPQSWGVEGDLKLISYPTADIRVSSANQFPYVENNNLCGLPGDFIELPKELFDNANTGDLGENWKVLLVSWARYRWGAYEEHGAPGDKQFPYFVRDVAAVDDEPKWVPNGCTNGEDKLVGAYKNLDGTPCDPTSASDLGLTCRFYPDKMLQTTMSVSASKPPLYILLDNGLADNNDASVLNQVIPILGNYFNDIDTTGNHKELIVGVGEFPTVETQKNLKPLVPLGFLSENKDDVVKAIGNREVVNVTRADFGEALQQAAAVIKATSPVAGGSILFVKTSGAKNTTDFSTEKEVELALRRDNIKLFTLEIVDLEKTRQNLVKIATETQGDAIAYSRADSSKISTEFRDWLEKVLTGYSSPPTPTRVERIAYSGSVSANNVYTIPVWSGTQKLTFMLTTVSKILPSEVFAGIETSQVVIRAGFVEGTEFNKARYVYTGSLDTNGWNLNEDFGVFEPVPFPSGATKSAMLESSIEVKNTANFVATIQAIRDLAVSVEENNPAVVKIGFTNPRLLKPDNANLGPDIHRVYETENPDLFINLDLNKLPAGVKEALRYQWRNLSGVPIALEYTRTKLDVPLYFVAASFDGTITSRLSNVVMLAPFDGENPLPTVLSKLISNSSGLERL
ncbi:unnamed protein product [Allacma fusca]|uniref:VWFA domain-containing protein n=1 Tax=Allacma fusca TaxID=39272 RepID=A0A8J2KWU4_9HEXA|nr:unnamed protein product [Allacma fusca]